MPTQIYTNAVGAVLRTSAPKKTQVTAWQAGDQAFGTAGNDMLWSVAANQLLAGGAGDDWYMIYGASATVVEQPGSGTDVVMSFRQSYALAAEVENLTVASPGGAGFGNALDNILIASGDGAHTLDGGRGNDVLVGSSSGTDRFVFARGSGSDAIEGFTPGQDVIQLDGFTGAAVSGFPALRTAMRQAGADVIVDMGAGQALVLRGVLLGALSARDFALPAPTTGLRLTFDEEFTGAFSASPDGLGTTWRTRLDQGGLGGRTYPRNGEAQYYSDSSVGVDPFGLRDGVLTITAAPAAPGTAGGQPYTSGTLTTSKSFAQQYGYFEIRAQLPAGKGFWPAFWMLPADGSWPPELDVFEVLGNDPSTLYASTHGGVDGSQVITINQVHTMSLANGFHTYGVLWNASTVTWYLDGNQIASSATPAEMNKPMYMLVNLAVGGAQSWPGVPDGGAFAQMRVDYVRAYATEDTVGVSGSAALAQPVALTLSGWGRSVVRGDGLYAVTGSGSGGRVVLGNGDQGVSLTGYQNTVQLGAGDHRVVLAGTANTVTVGRGASSIDAGGSYAKVTVGASLAGTTTVRAAGSGAVVTATGDGSVSVSGTTGTARVSLGNGDHQLQLGGGGNIVTTGRGNSTIQAGTAAAVHAGSGDDAITVTGWGSLLDGGGGSNTLVGGTGSDTFVLNAAGMGYDRVSGFKLTNADRLDLTRTLAGAGLAPDLSNLGRFLSARQDADGTTLLADVTGGGGGVGYATLVGVQASIAQLAAAHAIVVGGVRT